MNDYVWSVLCAPPPTHPQLPTLPLCPQEMIALGCSNFFGSFFKIHVICCALSVTLAVDGAGGKSQVSLDQGSGKGIGCSSTVAPENPGQQVSSLPLLSSVSTPPNAFIGGKKIKSKNFTPTPRFHLFLWIGVKSVCVPGGDGHHAGPGILSLRSPQGKTQHQSRRQPETPVRAGLRSCVMPHRLQSTITVTLRPGHNLRSSQCRFYSRHFTGEGN